MSRFIEQLRENLTIKAVACHRNGVGGNPFYVGLVQDGKETMLVISFEDRYSFAALSVADLAAGNIHPHPLLGEDLDEVEGTGDAGYRGDVYTDALYERLREAAEAQSKQQHERFMQRMQQGRQS